MRNEEAVEQDRSARREAGAAICGEKIIAQARKIIRKSLVTGSSSHRIQTCDLEGNAYCVVSKAFRISKTGEQYSWSFFPGHHAT